jgi:hypothetical protein
MTGGQEGRTPVTARGCEHRAHALDVVEKGLALEVPAAQLSASTFKSCVAVVIAGQPHMECCASARDGEDQECVAPWCKIWGRGCIGTLSACRAPKAGKQNLPGLSEAAR